MKSIFSDDYNSSSISIEFFQIFGEDISVYKNTSLYIPQHKSVVDREYLLSLIFSGTPSDFARAINLPFDDFAKQFYGDILKIFYHYYDVCFEITHFPVKFPYLVDFILHRNNSINTKKLQECTLAI